MNMILRKVKDESKVKIKFLNYTLYKRSLHTNKQDFLHGFFTIERTNKRKIYRLLGIRIGSKKNQKISYNIESTNKIVSPNNINMSYLKNNYDVLKDQLPINIADIQKYIEVEDIKIVSFDIFDTLLVRPTFDPSDVLYLLSQRVKEKYNIDLLDVRLSAEAAIGSDILTIYDIYDYIAEKLSLNEKTKQLLIQEEFGIESKLLTVRKDIKKVYDIAVKSHKKIIAVSDMYLPEDYLLKVLHNKGFNEIEKVYVSCNYHKRKDTGELYNVVIAKEKIKPSSILHIGDNYHSDYLKALEKYITAVYYPSIKDIVFSEKSIYKDALSDYMYMDRGQRLLIGFSFNRIFSECERMPDKPYVFSDIEFFVKLFLAPVTLHIALKIIQNNQIQTNYNIVNFASRDGYLPKLAYDFLKEKLFKTTLPSKYLYLSRRSYYLFEYGSVIEYIKKITIQNDPSYKFHHLLEALITDKEVLNKLLNGLSEAEKNVAFYENKKLCIDKLKDFKKILDAYEAKVKNNVIKFFQHEIRKNSTGRAIIFDIGYSGSVAAALKNITNVIFDKIYLFDTPKNRKLDKINNSKTFNIIPEMDDFKPIHLLFEELFSPYQGPCIGYNAESDNTIGPIFENLPKNKNMEKIYKLIKSELINYLSDFVDLFGSYSNNFNIHDVTALLKMYDFSVKGSPYCEMNILKNIIFPDPIVYIKNFSLQYKLMKYTNNFENVFTATGFYNPEKKCNIKSSLMPSFNKKVGIHCHLYNVDLSQEIIKYMKDFPVKFDLILTISCTSYENVVNKLFNNNIINNLNKLIIKVVPNRGRDVAPWLVSTKEEQSNYDLFCHIHTKKTQNAIWANRWRNYLYSNLIKKDSVIDIFNLFETNDNLGIIINDFYPELANFCIQKNIPIVGQAGENSMIDDILHKMGYSPLIPRNDLLFAAGTMFWYNPKALLPLFNLNLTYENFPEEPIGVEGTIAHAIERLPALICERNGYESLVYTKYLF